MALLVSGGELKDSDSGATFRFREGVMEELRTSGSKEVAGTNPHLGAGPGAGAPERRAGLLVRAGLEES